MSFFPKNPASRNGTTQVIAYSTTTAITNAFGSETFQIRLVADSACCYRIGDGAQTATVADPFLPANWVEYVIVSPGQRLSVIKAATEGLVTSTNGTLWVTELS